jgi:hypothetical protein
MNNQTYFMNFIIANPYWFVAICTFIALTIKTISRKSHPSVWMNLICGIVNALPSLFWPYYLLTVLILRLIGK